MAKRPTKGTTLQLEIASVLATVAQVLELDVGAQEPVVIETPTLDQADAGIPRDTTGYVNQSPITGSCYYDYDDPTHQFVAAQSQAPGTKVAGAVVGPSASYSLGFTAAAIGFGPLTIRHNDMLKSSFNIPIDGLVTFPTS